MQLVTTVFVEGLWLYIIYQTTFICIAHFILICVFTQLDLDI